MARILEAALAALASDPDASMAEIARRAGLVRATIYVHFPTRESLIEAVTERAIAEVIQAMAAADPDRDDPAEALQRLLATAWGELGRFHALVGLNAHQRLVVPVSRVDQRVAMGDVELLVRYVVQEHVDMIRHRL